MKKPFLYALAAALYIAIIVLSIDAVGAIMRDREETIFIPMAMLSLFVLSAAIMGFLFLSEPFHLYMENQKQEAVAFFAKVVGIFACFAAVFLILLFLV